MPDQISNQTHETSELVNLNVRVPDKLRRELKVACALLGVTLAEGLQMSLDAWRAENFKKRSDRT